MGELLKALELGEKREHKYLLLLNDDSRLQLFNPGKEEVVTEWSPPENINIWTAEIYQNELYYGYITGGIKNACKKKVVLKRNYIASLFVHEGRLFAIADLPPEFYEVEPEVKSRLINKKGLKYINWVFSEGKYVHYVTKDDHFVIAEFDVETGEIGEEIFKGGCLNASYISQTEKVGDWFLTAGYNTKLVAFKPGGVLKRGLRRKVVYSPSGIFRFSVLKRLDGYEIYTGFNELTRIRTDREFNVLEREEYPKIKKVYPLFFLTGEQAEKFFGYRGEGDG